MKKLRVPLVVMLTFMASCVHKKIIEDKKPVIAEEKVAVSLQNEYIEQKQSYLPFSSALLQKTNDGTVYKNASEIIGLIPQLNPADYVSLAFHSMFHHEIPTIKDKITIIQALQNASSDAETKSILQFFSQILVENQTYLNEHPLTDLQASLVNEQASTSSEYFKDHPEVSDVVWSIEELYKTGNNLLQEAVRLNNYAAVHFLLKQGASPRHLDDPRGVVLALEWADKYGYQEIAQELASTVNQLNAEHITLLDELLPF